MLNREVKNKLNYYLKIEQAKRVIEHGEKVLLKDIEAELGKHCGVTRDAIFSIKRGNSTASLPVALKIAEYFNTNIEDVFFLTKPKETKISVLVEDKNKVGSTN
jgi:DNA-binding XRE family transcriptional regulator